MSHKKILKIEEQEKLLEKELETIKKKLDKIQEEKMLFQKSCSPHINKKHYGWEHGSDRNIFKCDDCHFIGYYTDFSK